MGRGDRGSRETKKPKGWKTPGARKAEERAQRTGQSIQSLPKSDARISVTVRCPDGGEHHVHLLVRATAQDAAKSCGHPANTIHVNGNNVWSGFVLHNDDVVEVLS